MRATTALARAARWRTDAERLAAELRSFLSLRPDAASPQDAIDRHDALAAEEADRAPLD